MSNKLFYNLIIYFCCILGKAYGQQSVGVGTSVPNNSAVLEIYSTSKGILPPRLSHAERNNMAGPAAGLIIWCSDCGIRGEMQVFDGIDWKKISSYIGSIPSPPSTGRISINSTETVPSPDNIQ